MDKLGKYIKQVRGVTYNPKDISEIHLEDYLPILKANNIQENGLDTTNLIYIHKSKIKDEQLIRKGDLLLAASSGSKDIVGKNVFFESNFNGSFGAFCKVVRPNENIYPKFLSVFFKTPNYKRHIRKLIQGANINNLRNEDIDSLKIPEFTSNEQIQIADLLSSADDLLKQRKESILLLDKFLTSTFFEMFGDPVSNGMRWSKVPLSKLGSLDRGVSKNRPRNLPELLGGKYPLIQTGEVSKAGLYITKYTHTYSELGLKQSKLWKKGTMLITIAANIAQTCILTFDACFPDSIVGFVADEKESNTIYIHYLFSFFQKLLERNAPQAAQKNINLALLRSLPVPQPSLKLQNKFASIVDKAEALRKDYQDSLQELENLYGSLSQQAFKGELKFRTTSITSETVNLKIKEEVKITLIPKEEVVKEIPKEEKPKKKFRIFSPFENVSSLATVTNYKPVLADIHPFIHKTFQEKHFTFDNLKQATIKAGWQYDFETLKNFVLELLRKAKLKQVFADAAFKSTFKEDETDAKTMKEVKDLTEQMYLQRAAVL